MRTGSSCVRSSSRSTTGCSAGSFARELEPGERISPPEIAADLGVSITPVRDAVNQMAAEGLVTVTPRRGTVVSPVSIRDIEELYEIRLMVEPHGGGDGGQPGERGGDRPRAGARGTTRVRP